MAKNIIIVYFCLFQKENILHFHNNNFSLKHVIIYVITIAILPGIEFFIFEDGCCCDTVVIKCYNTKYLLRMVIEAVTLASNSSSDSCIRNSRKNFSLELLEARSVSSLTTKIIWISSKYYRYNINTQGS